MDIIKIKISSVKALEFLNLDKIEPLSHPAFLKELIRSINGFYNFSKGKKATSG